MHRTERAVGPHDCFPVKEIFLNLFVQGNVQLNLIAKGALAVPSSSILDLSVSPDANVIAQKPRILGAVCYQRLFVAQFQFQPFSQKCSDFGFDVLAILFAANDADEKIISVTHIIDAFIRLRLRWQFHHLRSLLFLFLSQGSNSARVGFLFEKLAYVMDSARKMHIFGREHSVLGFVKTSLHICHGRQPMIKKARGNTVVLTQTRRRLQTASIE